MIQRITMERTLNASGQWRRWDIKVYDGQGALIAESNGRNRFAAYIDAISKVAPSP